MSRWKAAGIHLALSAIVGLATVTLLFLYWYPGSLFEATGGRGLVFLIVGIDVVAGPLLTLIVFRSGKPGLKADLAIICAAQLAFLAYGFFVATQARPVFIVFRGDRFAVVSSNDVDDDDLAQAPEPLRKRSLSGPVYVAAAQPTSEDERQALAMSALDGRDIEMFPKYYRPYADFKDAIVAAGRPLDELAAVGDAQRAEVERFLATREDDADLVFLPVTARFKNMSAVVSRSSGEIVELLRADPWPPVGTALTPEPEPASEPAPAPAPATPGEAPAPEAEPASGDDTQSAPAPSTEPDETAPPSEAAA